MWNLSAGKLQLFNKINIRVIFTWFYNIFVGERKSDMRSEINGFWMCLIFL